MWQWGCQLHLDAHAKAVPPAVKADVGPQPLHPLGHVALHKGLRVVNVGRCIKAVPGGGVPCATFRIS